MCRSQDLTQYHSMIVTSIEPSKSSWLLGTASFSFCSEKELLLQFLLEAMWFGLIACIAIGGSTRLNFEGSEDELKLCFSIAQVNYDPVRYREHFSALKTIYKVYLLFLDCFEKFSFTV